MFFGWGFAMPASRQPHNRKASLVLSGVSVPSSALWPAANRKPRLEHLQWGMGFGSTFDKRGFYPGSSAGWYLMEKPRLVSVQQRGGWGLYLF